MNASEILENLKELFPWYWIIFFYFSQGILPPETITVVDKVTVVFRSDSSVNYRGFLVAYQINEDASSDVIDSKTIFN